MRFFTSSPALSRRIPLTIAWILGAFIFVLIVLIASPRARMGTVRVTLDVLGAELPRDEHGFTNLMLLGTGDELHDGADLTDTMIVASIDTATRGVTMISLPRDLFIEMAGPLVDGRINALYANEKHRLMIREKMTEAEASQAAMKAVSAAVGEKLGTEIHGVIKADFTAFVETVDALGGVDVDVKETIVDHTYPISETNVGLFRIEAGMHRLDGETALKYARSRHSTSDFDRSARQQQLIAALVEKARGLGRFAQLRLLFDLNERLRDHTETTLSFEQSAGIAQIASDLSLDRTIAAQINSDIGGDGLEASPGGFVTPAPLEMFEGASILLPAFTEGQSDWRHIATFAHMLMRFRAERSSRPMIAVVDAGAPGLEAHRLRNELLRYDWETAELERVDIDPTPAESVVHYADDAHRDAARHIGALLSMPVDRMREGAGSGDIVITLGSSFDHLPFASMSGAVLR